MYAIIRSGGNQFKAEPGKTLRVNRLGTELGKEFDIDEVLFIGGDNAVVGNPTVAKAKVRVVVTQHGREEKVLILKKKRRKGYRRTRGYRADFTDLFVLAVTGPDGKSVKAENKPNVLDPAVIAERKAKFLAAQSAKPKAAKAEAKKAVAKKAAAPKKKVAKKKAGAKKSTKKTAAKTTKKKA